MSSRKPSRKLLSGLFYSILLVLWEVLYQAFVPAHYQVAQEQKNPRTGFWNLPTGSRIAYVKIPAKEKRKPYPFVYLHGGPGGFITSRNIELLAQLSEVGYDTYLHDEVGSGQSERLDEISEYRANGHLLDLEEIHKKTGAEKVILIGQSWRAILACLFRVCC